jgi:hypothetical protein
MNDAVIRIERGVPAETVLAQNAEVIRALGKRVIGDVIEIGRRLSESKQLCGHGNWLPWLEREFGWSDDTARNYMQVSELAESRNFRDLSLPISGLYLLAAPSTPEEVRQEVIERVENGERLSVKHVKELIDEARNKQKMEPPNCSPSAKRKSAPSMFGVIGRASRRPSRKTGEPIIRNSCEPNFTRWPKSQRR